MSATKVFALVLAAVVTSLVTADSTFGVVASVPSTVMVVPARLRMVEFGFELARLRNVGLVSYQVDTRKNVFLHVWNGREWAAVAREVYESGGFLLGAPKNLIVVGPDAMVPEFLTTPPAWCPQLERIPSLDIGELVNRLGAILKFRDREWKALAARYNLTIEDQNAERRRYGKYGPPGQKRTMPMPPPEAALIEKSGEQDVKEAAVAPVSPAVQPAPAAVKETAVAPVLPAAQPAAVKETVEAPVLPPAQPAEAEKAPEVPAKPDTRKSMLIMPGGSMVVTEPEATKAPATGTKTPATVTPAPPEAEVPAAAEVQAPETVAPAAPLPQDK